MFNPGLIPSIQHCDQRKKSFQSSINASCFQNWLQSCENSSFQFGKTCLDFVLETNVLLLLRKNIHVSDGGSTEKRK